jgi:hypothetical protein
VCSAQVRRAARASSAPGQVASASGP